MDFTDYLFKFNREFIPQNFMILSINALTLQSDTSILFTQRIDACARVFAKILFL